METEFPYQTTQPDPPDQPPVDTTVEHAEQVKHAAAVAPAEVVATEDDVQVEEARAEAVSGTDAAASDLATAAAPAGPSAWTERRAARRFAMQLPVFVTVSAGDLAGSLKDHATVTRDVSASGVFFEMETPLPVNTEIEFTLTLPREITHSQAIRVHCLGTVVRCESGETGGRSGVAAVIDEFDLLA